jgi:hypothetical protein
MEERTYQQLIVDLSKNVDLGRLNAGFSGEKNFEILRNNLASYLYDLLMKDYSALMNLLYRIDVKEEIVAACLMADNLRAAADCLSDAVIERQLQKIRFRQQGY